MNKPIPTPLPRRVWYRSHWKKVFEIDPVGWPRLSWTPHSEFDTVNSSHIYGCSCTLREIISRSKVPLITDQSVCMRKHAGFVSSGTEFHYHFNVDVCNLVERTRFPPLCYDPLERKLISRWLSSLSLKTCSTKLAIIRSWQQHGCEIKKTQSRSTAYMRQGRSDRKFN